MKQRLVGVGRRQNAFPVLVLGILWLVHSSACARADEVGLRLTLSWGHRSTPAQPFVVKLTAQDLTITDLKLEDAEASDQLQDQVVRGRAGGGDVDRLTCRLQFPARVIEAITNAHSIWMHLLQHGDSEAAQRLRSDPAWRPDSRKLTIQLDEAATRGVSLTVDQLLTQASLWLPELDLFIATGDVPESLGAHLQSLQDKGKERVLDRVAREPEATYAQYTARWEDMGSPNFQNPHSVPPGHSVGLGWDSGLYKFGVDRWAEVRNDYAKEDVFHFRFVLPKADLAWRGQKLADGLPIVTTTFESDGVRYQMEQFAFPLLGPPKERRGDIAMVLLQKVQLQELDGRAKSIDLEMQLTRDRASSVSLQAAGLATLLKAGEATSLAVQGADLKLQLNSDGKMSRIGAQVALPAGGKREFIVKLPSPVVSAEESSALVALDYGTSRQDTVRFWEEWLAQGASFNVPDAAVNTLFRANLWHALRLPRRHGVGGTNLIIDLPYSNFAYDQKGTPWPVNQAVYVDYMLYDLRGYHGIAAEELAAMYRNNQEPNGHVGGFANWGVYTPSMLYSVAQHYLLSGDRSSFEQLLPPTLRALDWCLAEVAHADSAESKTPGLVLAPLNDLTHEPRSWAFNQAYFVAGFETLGRALEDIHHPKAQACRAAAAKLREAIQREFARASVRSPAVQLADGSWGRYVPTDAQASGRLFQVWYPTDVDVGPLHLPRLNAVDPRGPLTTAMLQDHEDNLFIRQWGTINEPVYNMQGTVYLLRDEPKAAIRTFYSTMACAFSHSVFEPVEHRWGWGQYFGPPSTDGAWFELYRNMLLREPDDESLLIGQATPRVWLEKGKLITVRRAPTHFGPVSFELEGQGGQLLARVELSGRRAPSGLLVRFRHPELKPIRSVSVNGQNWTDFDPDREWVRIPAPTENLYTIITHHEP